MRKIERLGPVPDVYATQYAKAVAKAQAAYDKQMAGIDEKQQHELDSLAAIAEEYGGSYDGAEEIVAAKYAEMRAEAQARHDEEIEGLGPLPFEYAQIYAQALAEVELYYGQMTTRAEHKAAAELDAIGPIPDEYNRLYSEALRLVEQKYVAMVAAAALAAKQTVDAWAIVRGMFADLAREHPEIFVPSPGGGTTPPPPGGTTPPGGTPSATIPIEQAVAELEGWFLAVRGTMPTAEERGFLSSYLGYTGGPTITRAQYESGAAAIAAYLGTGAVPQLATGGVVTMPTLAMIGERGPEAVMPLSMLAERDVALAREITKLREEASADRAALRRDLDDDDPGDGRSRRAPRRADRRKAPLMGSYAQTVIADGASHYWRLHDTSGTTATDLIGGAHGTIGAGVTLNQPGALADGDPAMTFDGTSAGKILAPTLALSAGFTFEFFSRLNTVAGGLQFLLAVQVGTAGSFIGIDRTSQLWITRFMFGGAAKVIVGPAVDLAWHHVVVTYDGAILRLYVDAAMVGSIAASGSLDASASCVIGNYFDVYGWPGSLDEVAIYPHALTATQIAEHYALRSAPRGPVVVTLEAESRNNEWTDLSADLVVESVRWTRGITGAGPLDRIAAPGSLTFAVDNTSDNSQGVADYYTPYHPAAPDWWRHGLRVRLHLTNNVAARYVWCGRLHTITPEPDLYGLRLTHCLAADWMNEFALADAIDLPLRLNNTSDLLLTELYHPAVHPAGPARLRSRGCGLPVAFDDLGSTIPKATAVAQDLVQGEFGYLYLRGDDTTGETLRFEHRLTRTTAPPLYTFTYRGPGA